MSPNQVLGIVRALLNALAAIAIAHGVSEGTWDGIAGAVVALATIAWGVFSHAATLDQALSVARALLALAGGYAVQRGWATNEEITQYGGIVAVVVPTIWTWFVHADPSAVSAANKTLTIVGPGAAIALALLLAGSLSGCDSQGNLTGSALSGVQGALAVSCPVVNVVASDVANGTLTPRRPFPRERSRARDGSEPTAQTT